LQPRRELAEARLIFDRRPTLPTWGPARSLGRWLAAARTRRRFATPTEELVERKAARGAPCGRRSAPAPHTTRPCRPSRGPTAGPRRAASSRLRRLGRRGPRPPPLVPENGVERDGIPRGPRPLSEGPQLWLRA